MSELFKSYSKIYIAIAGIAILTSVTSGVFLLALNFDGIEFNGDSFVYFSDGKYLLSTVSSHVFPKPAHWPYGYASMLSLACAIGDVSFESARWVNVIFGGLLAIAYCSVLLLVSRIKKISFNQAILVVLAAGILPLGHGFFLKYQMTMMSDMMASFMSVLIMLLCWRWRASDKITDIMIAGIVLGLSVSTRYVSGLMVIPALAVLFCDIDLQRKDFIKRNILATLLFSGSALLAFSPQLYIMLQDTSSPLGNGLLNGWNIRNFFAMTHESIDGRQVAQTPSVLYYFNLPFTMECYTLLGIIFSGLGIKYSIRELPRWFWLSMLVWYLVFYTLLCGIPLQNARIGFSLYIPITIWMSLGLLECMIKWKNYFNKILILTSLIWLVSLFYSIKGIQYFVRAKNELKATAESVVKTVPPDSRIISTSLYAVYNAYPMAIKHSSIYEMSIEEARNLLATDTLVFLVIDEDHFIPQWGNYLPGKCYDWIKSNYNCKVKYKIADYTVYEIRPRFKL
jgi:hypothetical protein